MTKIYIIKEYFYTFCFKTKPLKAEYKMFITGGKNGTA